MWLSSVTLWSISAGLHKGSCFEWLGTIISQPSNTLPLHLFPSTTIFSKSDNPLIWNKMSSAYQTVIACIRERMQTIPTPPVMLWQKVYASDLVSNKCLSGVKVLGLGWCLIGLIQLTQRRVLGQSLGTALAWGQSEGVYPKKSLQWTRGLVIRGETVYLLLLNR